MTGEKVGLAQIQVLVEGPVDKSQTSIVLAGPDRGDDGQILEAGRAGGLGSSFDERSTQTEMLRPAVLAIAD
jgi:hypothetical protein